MKSASRARASGLETLRFTLELLKRIPRGRKVSAPELHKEMLAAGFRRDLRTVQRQLDELTQQFDIERDDRSKPYGYSWKPAAKGLSVPGLNEKESLLLALAEQHLANLLPLEVLRSMQPFFEQARVNLAPHAAASAQAARAWINKVRVVSTSQPLLAPRILPEVFSAVSSALYADQWLKVQYRNSAGNQLDACVMPLGLAQQGTRLYLVCRFEGYEDERSLALNRILEASNTGRPFARPPEFDLGAFDDAGGFGFGSGKRIQLEILIQSQAAVHLLESKLSQDQSSAAEGDRYRIKATVCETEQLKWWLRGFGNAVKVVRPASLAKQL
jgi:predicted DNA-binding transcriptional regulator YafY